MEVRYSDPMEEKFLNNHEDPARADELRIVQVGIENVIAECRDRLSEIIVLCRNGNLAVFFVQSLKIGHDAVLQQSIERHVRTLTFDMKKVITVVAQERFSFLEGDDTVLSLNPNVDTARQKTEQGGTEDEGVEIRGCKM
jgi:hypothetical protein